MVCRVVSDCCPIAGRLSGIGLGNAHGVVYEAAVLVQWTYLEGW
jgi:hypothetical protein